MFQFHTETPALELSEGVCSLLTGAVYIGRIQVVCHSADLRNEGKGNQVRIVEEIFKRAVRVEH